MAFLCRLFRADTVKLSPKWCGPFQIEAMVGPNAAVLALPGSVHKRKHRTFNVDKLAPWHDSDRFPRCHPAHPSAAAQAAEEADPEELFRIRKFLQCEQRRNHRRQKRWEVLVRWENYGPADDSWEPKYCMQRDIRPRKAFKKFLDCMPNTPPDSEEDEPEAGPV